MGEHAFMVAEELGLTIIDMADRVSKMEKVSPGTQAKYVFEMDGEHYEVVLRLTNRRGE